MPTYLSQREHLDPVNMAFAIFAFVAASGFFNTFGMITVAFAIVYLGAALLIMRLFVHSLTHPRIRLAPWSLPIVFVVSAFPLLSLFSTFWSVDAAETFRNAIQLCFTCVFGVLIGRTLGLTGAFYALTGAMFICVIASVGNIFVEIVPAWSQDDFVGARRYMVGVYSQKNPFGHVIFLFAWGVIYIGLENGRRGLVLGLIAALTLSPLVKASGSSTASILYVLVLTMPLFHLVLSGTRSLLLTTLLATTGLILILVILGFMGMSITDLVFGAFGKDATLTGRTAIWDVAFEQFRGDPFIGIGYQVFWSAPAFAPLVSLVQGTVVDGVNTFHNAFIEAAIGTGIIGVIFLAMLPICVITLALRRLASAPTPAATGVFYLSVLLTTRTFVEGSLAFQHQIDFLTFTTLAIAFASPAVCKSDEKASQ